MFEVNFETDNAAFADGGELEIAIILEKIADQVRNQGRTEGVIKDSNGNTVGEWNWTEPEVV